MTGDEAQCSDLCLTGADLGEPPDEGQDVEAIAQADPDCPVHGEEAPR